MIDVMCCILYAVITKLQYKIWTFRQYSNQHNIG